MAVETRKTLKNKLDIDTGFRNGIHTITAGEATANTVAITVSDLKGDISNAIVQVIDSGNNVVTSDADVTFSGKILTVADGASYNTVAGNKIRYIVFGPQEA